MRTAPDDIEVELGEASGARDLQEKCAHRGESNT